VGQGQQGQQNGTAAPLTAIRATAANTATARLLACVMLAGDAQQAWSCKSWGTLQCIRESDHAAGVMARDRLGG
jgi:hypothetical protein